MDDLQISTHATLNMSQISDIGVKTVLFKAGKR